jgi:hypothetical protein
MRDNREWLTIIEQHYQNTEKSGGSIVLFPRYRPDLCMQLAHHLGLGFYDYRAEEMQQQGQDAGSLTLEQLDKSLCSRAQMSGIVSHNIEALLCVKPETERRAWLRSFLNADWPNPIFLPITVFQADAPDEHSRVCDLELLKMPAERLAAAAQTGNRMKYNITL